MSNIKNSPPDNAYVTLEEFEKQFECTRLETLKLMREGILLRKDSGDIIHVAWKDPDNHPTLQELRNGSETVYKKLNKSQPLEEKEKKDIEKTEEHNRIISIPFVTSDSFATSKTIKTLGMVRGSTVRAKHIGRDFLAEIKNLVGGELKGYTELLADGREEAIYRMQSDAERLGANAVVSVRFTSSTIGGGIAEILAYGTAVIIEE